MKTDRGFRLVAEVIADRYTDDELRSSRARLRRAERSRAELARVAAGGCAAWDCKLTAGGPGAHGHECEPTERRHLCGDHAHAARLADFER